MTNEMNGMMNGQAMAMGTPMMGAPVQQMMPQAPVQQMQMQPQAAYTAQSVQKQKIHTKDCAIGARATVKGKLGFSYYLTRPKMGEALAKSIQREEMMGRQPNDKPRFEATITDPEIVLDGRTPAEETMVEKYLSQKFYTNKKGERCFSFQKTFNPLHINLPKFMLRGSDKVFNLANQSLAEGQTVYITFEIGKGNGNNGCYVKLIEFEKEPEFYVSNNEYGEVWTPDTAQQTASAPAAPVAPVSQPQAQAPVRGGWGVPQTQMPVQQQMMPQAQAAYTAPVQQTTPVGDGFAPVPEGAVYQEASFWQ